MAMRSRSSTNLKDSLGFDLSMSLEAMEIELQSLKKRTIESGEPRQRQSLTGNYPTIVFCWRVDSRAESGHTLGLPVPVTLRCQGRCL